MKFNKKLKQTCFLLYCPETVHLMLSELAMKIKWGVTPSPSLNSSYKKEWPNPDEIMNHRITELSNLEGIQKDHWAQLLGKWPPTTLALLAPCSNQLRSWFIHHVYTPCNFTLISILEFSIKWLWYANS